MASQIIKNNNFREIAKNVRPDAKKRIVLSKISPPKDVTYRIYSNEIGQVILDPHISIPASEVWLYKNQAAAGSRVSKTGSPVDARFPISPKRLKDFCRKHHIKKLSLFGSVLRNDYRPDSDIDVLVEFTPGHTPGFEIVTIQNELALLLGRPVDIRTGGDLSRYFRDNVIKEARVKYEES